MQACISARPAAKERERGREGERGGRERERERGREREREREKGEREREGEERTCADHANLRGQEIPAVLTKMRQHHTMFMFLKGRIAHFFSLFKTWFLGVRCSAFCEYHLHTASTATKIIKKVRGPKNSGLTHSVIRAFVYERPALFTLRPAVYRGLRARQLRAVRAHKVFSFVNFNFSLNNIQPCQTACRPLATKRFS